MLGFLDFLFLSYKGRIGRTAYWLGLFGLTLAQIGAIWFLLHLSKADPGTISALADDSSALRERLGEAMFNRVVWPVIIVFALFLYPTYAIYTKRWHDRNKSGVWSLIQFVPIIGGLWMFIELGFLGGDDGQNTYGTR